MEWFALVLPILIILLGRHFFKDRLVWWELLLPLAVTVVTIVIMKVAMVYSLTADTEYFSEYVVEAQHTDRWNEYIHKTCSYTTCTGSGKTRHCTTHHYDCSYVQNHPERWAVITNEGHEYSVSQSHYNSLVKLFSNEKFKDMHRKYHSIDGDRHYTVFDNNFDHVQPYSFSETYENKTQACHTLFHFSDLEDKDTIGLYNYPKIIKGKQSSCLGCSESNDYILRSYNGLIGSKYEVKMFVLIFEGQDIEIAERQRQYWKNGNKNELVVCVDSESRWAKSFSWCDNKEVEVRANSIFMNDTLTMKTKLGLLEKDIEQHWERKHFSDFAYIKVPLSGKQMIWLYITVFLVSIGMICIGIFNNVNL